jgi:hypothetical protein
MRRPRPTYANVMSTLAVFLCLGGTAVAATQINGSSIDNRSIAGKKLIKHTVTAAEVKTSSLPYVKGKHSKVYTVHRILKSIDNGTAPLMLVPKIGTFEVECANSGNDFTVHYTNTTAHKTHYSSVTTIDGSGGTVSTHGGRTAAGADIELGIGNSGGSAGFSIDAKFMGYQDHKAFALSVGGITDLNGKCEFAATGIAG